MTSMRSIIGIIVIFSVIECRGNYANFEYLKLHYDISISLNLALTGF